MTGATTLSKIFCLNMIRCGRHRIFTIINGVLLVASIITLMATLTIQSPILNSGDIVSLSYYDEKHAIAQIDEVNDTHVTITHPYAAFAIDADVIIMKGQFQCNGMIIDNHPNRTKAYLPHGRILRAHAHHSSSHFSRTKGAGCSSTNQKCS